MKPMDKQIVPVSAIIRKAKVALSPVSASLAERFRPKKFTLFIGSFVAVEKIKSFISNLEKAVNCKINFILLAIHSETFNIGFCIS